MKIIPDWSRIPTVTLPDPKAADPTTTIELLDSVLATGESERQVSRMLGMDPNTLARQRNRGRLTPTVAGSLAMHTGRDIALWTALAALEGEADSPKRTTLLQRLNQRVRNF